MALFSALLVNAVALCGTKNLIITTGVASQCGKCACLAKQVVRETLTQLQTAQAAIPYSAEFTHA